MRQGVRTSVLFILQALVSQSLAKPKTPHFVGVLLDKTWNTTNGSYFSNVNFQSVVLSTNGLGFEDIINQGCRRFAENRIVSLIGPEDGLIGGIGELFAHHFSIPYIGLGTQTNKLVSVTYNIFIKRQFSCIF
jgi:hypothetical protein